MIVRIVKMHFRPEETDNFLRMFDEIRQKINHYEGCFSLSLLKKNDNPELMFTHSTWKDEAALDKYRHSEFFAETWKKTKQKFASPAEAWTLLEYENNSAINSDIHS